MTNEIMEILKKAGYHVKCFNCNIVNNFWDGNSDIIPKINDGDISMDDIELPEKIDIINYMDAINEYNLTDFELVCDNYSIEKIEKFAILLKMSIEEIENLTIYELHDAFVEAENISINDRTELMLLCNDVIYIFDDYYQIENDFIDTMCIYNYIKTHENLMDKDIPIMLDMGCIAFEYEDRIYFRNYTSNDNMYDYVQFMLFSSLPSDSYYFRDEKYFFEYFTEEQKNAFKAKILALDIEIVEMYKRGK